MKSEGLGDDIAKLTKATRIDKLTEKLAKAFGYEDCGCDDRRKTLNEMFPYSNPKNAENIEEMEYRSLRKTGKSIFQKENVETDSPIAPDCLPCEAERKRREAMFKNE